MVIKNLYASMNVLNYAKLIGILLEVKNDF